MKMFTYQDNTDALVCAQLRLDLVKFSLNNLNDKLRLICQEIWWVGRMVYGNSTAQTVGSWYTANDGR